MIDNIYYCGPTHYILLRKETIDFTMMCTCVCVILHTFLDQENGQKVFCSISIDFKLRKNSKFLMYVQVISVISQNFSKLV